MSAKVQELVARQIARERLDRAAPALLAAMKPFLREYNRLGLSSLTADGCRITVIVNARDIRAAALAVAKAEGAA